MMQVGVVNDLRMAAEALRRIVAETPGFEVAWVAFDGESAVVKHREKPADIVLMDLIMPGIDGAQATEQIMKAHPCAVLVVTATVAGNRGLVFAAMGKGALDAVNTPNASTPEGADELRRKLVTVSRLVKSAKVQAPKTAVPVPSAATNAFATPAYVASGTVKPLAAGEKLPAVVGIGASTGGPQAIATILRGLPADFHAAIVIVQHLDRQFVPGLLKWLQRESKMPLRLAAQDEPLHRGGVWLADSEDHLIVRSSTAGGLRLHYTEDPQDVPHRPSVDVFFESLAALRDVHRCGVLLTGMGSDGATGLLALRQAGAPTFAQDPESSVVYGMPGVALKMGAVTEPTLLSEMAPRLLRFAGQ